MMPIQIYFSMLTIVEFSSDSCINSTSFRVNSSIDSASYPFCAVASTIWLLKLVSVVLPAQPFRKFSEN